MQALADSLLGNETGTAYGHGHGLVGHPSPRMNETDALPVETRASETTRESSSSSSAAYPAASSGAPPTATANGSLATGTVAEVDDQNPEPQVQDPKPQTQSPGPEGQHVSQPDAKSPSEPADPSQTPNQDPVSTDPVDVRMVDAASEDSKRSSEPPTQASPAAVPAEDASSTVANGDATQASSNNSAPTGTGESESTSVPDNTPGVAADTPGIDAGVDKTGTTAATELASSTSKGDPAPASLDRPSSLPPVTTGQPWTGPVSRSNSAGPGPLTSPLAGASAGGPTAAPKGVSTGAPTRSPTGAATTGPPAVSSTVSSTAAAPSTASASPAIPSVPNHSHHASQQVSTSQSPEFLSQSQPSFSSNRMSSFSPLPSTGSASPGLTSSNPPVSRPSGQSPLQAPAGPANPARPAPHFPSTHPPIPSTQPVLQAPSQANGGQGWTHPRPTQAHPQPGNQHQSPPDSPSHKGNRTSKFHDECEVLGRQIRKASPEAVRKIVRDHWEKCLLGSDYHLTFISNAAIHHARGDVINRAVRDFGQKMVHDARQAVAQHLTTEILDDIAPIIIQRASDRFLDRALQARLPSIPARSLLNALARSERLGYDADDIVEDPNENVFPPPVRAPGPTAEPTPKPATGPTPGPTAHHPAASVAQPRQAQSYQPLPSTHQRHQSHQPYPRHTAAVTPAAAAAPQQHPNGLSSTTAPQRWTVPQTPTTPAHLQPSASSKPSTDHRCPLCTRFFDSYPPYDHHVRKSVCQRQPPAGGWFATCTRCGQGFVSAMGLQYHTANTVCGGDPRPGPKAAPPPATPRSVGRPPASQPAEQPADMLPLIQSDIAGYAPRLPAPPPSSQPAARPSQPASQRSASFSVRPGFKAQFNELSPSANAALNLEIQAAKDTYRTRAEEARGTVSDRAELQRQLANLRNCMNSRMSTIRRRYGVRIRERRSQEELDEERSWFELPPPPSAGQGRNGAVHSHSPRTGEKRPNGAVDEYAADKKPRLAGHDQESTHAPPTPLKTLSVSQMNGGLHGTSATAAVQDPTAVGATPASPASSVVVKGLKPATRRFGGGSVAQPADIDSSSDSEGDGDIPAY